MPYDKNSFLAGIAVGRQMKGWSIVPGLPGRKRFFYYDGQSFAGFAIPNNPNYSVWHQQIPAEFGEHEIKLVQSVTSDGMLRLCGITTTSGVLDTEHYSKLSVRYEVVTPCIFSNGIVPFGFILEQSYGYGFVNDGPSVNYSPLNKAGNFVRTIDTHENPDARYFTVLVYTDRFDYNGNYLQYADVRIKDIWQHN